jgi:hypothetical protein
MRKLACYAKHLFFSKEISTMYVMILASLLAGQAGADAKGPSKDEKRVCRTIPSTGSRLGAKRVCLTERQREEQAEALEKELAQERNAPPPPPGSN